MKGRPAATLTRCSGKTLDRLAGRVFRPPSHGHLVDVPWRSCLARLHHWPYWSLGDSHRVAGLLGAGRLPRWVDLDGACVRLRRLDRMVGLPGAGWQRRDNERDVDSGAGGIWQSSRTLRSRSYSFERKENVVHATLEIQLRKLAGFRGIKVSKRVTEHSLSVPPCQESDQSLSCSEISPFFPQQAAH